MFIAAIRGRGCGRGFASSPNNTHDTATGVCTGSFAGPVWWLAWLLFPVEIISHLARPFSLSMRLFGNIFAEELIIGSLNRYIFPFLVSLPVMFLGLFASTIQAFIFVLLTMVYISGAVEVAHHDEEAHPAGHVEAPAAA